MKKYKIIIISLIIFLFGITAGYFIEEFTSAKKNENMAITTEMRTSVPGMAVAKEVPGKASDDNAVKEVQKPSVLLFQSRSCSSCDKIKPIWKALQKEYKKDFNFYEVDVDDQKNAPLCIEFLITTIPSIFIEDVPFRFRDYINPVIYNYLPRFEDELNRYLDMREILKRGMNADS